MTNYATEMRGNVHSPALAGRVRLVLGLTMIIAGLFFIVSPFVFLTDKKS